MLEKFIQAKDQLIITAIVNILNGKVITEYFKFLYLLLHDNLQSKSHNTNGKILCPV